MSLSFQEYLRIHYANIIKEGVIAMQDHKINDMPQMENLHPSLETERKPFNKNQKLPDENKITGKGQVSDAFNKNIHKTLGIKENYYYEDEIIREDWTDPKTGSSVPDTNMSGYEAKNAGWIQTASAKSSTTPPPADAPKPTPAPKPAPAPAKTTAANNAPAKSINGSVKPVTSTEKKDSRNTVSFTKDAPVKENYFYEDEI